YAKLNTGVDSFEMAKQGLTYLVYALKVEPALPAVMGLGLAVALFRARPREQTLALGCILYLIYVVRVGGDYMAGRFLTMPLFLAVPLIAFSRLPLEQPGPVAVLVLPFFILFWHPSAIRLGDMGDTGVGNERTAFEANLALSSFRRDRDFPDDH